MVFLLIYNIIIFSKSVVAISILIAIISKYKLSEFL